MQAVTSDIDRARVDQPRPIVELTSQGRLSVDIFIHELYLLMLNSNFSKDVATILLVLGRSLRLHYLGLLLVLFLSLVSVVGGDLHLHNLLERQRCGRALAELLFDCFLLEGRVDVLLDKFEGHFVVQD